MIDKILPVTGRVEVWKYYLVHVCVKRSGPVRRLRTRSLGLRPQVSRSPVPVWPDSTHLTPNTGLPSVKSISPTLLKFGLQHISIYIKIDIGNILYLLCICILDISRIGFCHLNMFLCQNVFSISYKITFPVQSLHCQSSVSLEKYILVRPKMQCFRPGSNRGPSVC